MKKNRIKNIALSIAISSICIISNIKVNTEYIKGCDNKNITAKTIQYNSNINNNNPIHITKDICINNPFSNDNLINTFYEDTEDSNPIIEEDTEDENVVYAMNDYTPYEGYITKYMDLKNRKDISVEDIDNIISIWTEEYESSEFIGKGEAFIKASKQTGYDPIFLLALAATESGWDVSKLHRAKNNPYSINMIDEDPWAGYIMGETFYDGIINGAQWIYDYYYEEGQTCLYDMIHGKKQYATAADDWISQIVQIMDKSYKMLP